MHGDERKRPALLIEAMNGIRQHLFSGASLTFKQDCDVADACCFVDLAQQGQQFLGAGYEPESLEAPAQIVVGEHGTRNSHGITSNAGCMAVGVRHCTTPFPPNGGKVGESCRLSLATGHFSPSLQRNIAHPL